jgi:murein DD-endopeptidase MepM/ murein hydrolase activator NlpD
MLTFLINNASKVYALFGTLWNRVKDAAYNAYSWAVSKASEALNAAKSYATNLYYSAVAAVNKALDAAKSFASSIVASAKSLIWGWVEAARAWASERIDWLRGIVTGWIEAAKSWALARVNDAIGLFELFFRYLRSQLDDLSGTIAPWQSLIDSLLALLSPENMRRLTLLLVGFFPALLKLITSPLEWVYSTISGSFVSFLCYILAQFMGTVKYTLPPPPSWALGAGGLFSPGGPGPGLSGSELSAPLARLYISGYRFGSGHPGLDLGLSRGAAVYAMHDGEVEVAGWSTVGYGNTITLRNGKWWTRYAHLDSFGVGKGDTVEAGQKIAEGNSTGNSTGDHLHLEIKLNGTFIDPEAVLF